MPRIYWKSVKRQKGAHKIDVHDASAQLLMMLILGLTFLVFITEYPHRTENKKTNQKKHETHNLIRVKRA